MEAPFKPNGGWSGQVGYLERTPARLNTVVQIALGGFRLVAGRALRQACFVGGLPCQMNVQLSYSRELQSH